ncbi:MAG: hypothetical protein H6709_20985 [Kofleriaceae bacterium]|nr:hypothetical protein [Myxococcales bacterium]MCB9562625.1 hypothetical protein [Kofleriaceae bacterium]MCB9574559.1 hypothetical protein [Kofleriaceae bacterium]
MSRTAGTAELIERLLAATPEPPGDEVAPDRVLGGAVAVLEQVGPLLGALRLATAERPVGLEVGDAITALQDRTRRWIEAAARARTRTLDQLTQLNRARRAGSP